jgi:hypothetical protein
MTRSKIKKIADGKIESRFSLITNLSYVTVEDVRTHTHALLVVREASPLSEGTPRCLLRGFSTSPALPTFDAVVPTDEFTLVDAHDPTLMIKSGAGGLRPLIRGSIMRIPGWRDVHLIAFTPRDVCVHRFPEGTDVGEVWEELERAVARHWDAPNMPRPQWIPATMVRAELGVDAE